VITTIALSFHHIIFLEGTKYMTILTRQEKERLVLDLYNQGKTYREISKEARISPRDIGVILNKTFEEKNTERPKEQQEEVVAHPSPSAQAYKLFSERKTPLEVAIALNLGVSEVTIFYREYWKLKQLHNLNTVYEELKDDIEPFLKLYKLAKRKGIGVRHVVDILTIANNDLPAIEERLKRLGNDMSMLQFQKHTCKESLYQLKNQIASTTKLLNSFRISCKRERREIENLYNEKARLEAIVTHFKNNNEEYSQIKQTVEENVKSVLTNSKIFLNFAAASVIESLRKNPELSGFVLNDISNNNTQQQQSFSYLNDDICIAVILDEAEKLYNKLTTKLTNEIMAAMKTIPSLPLPLSLSNNNQKLTYKDDEISSS
jgi:hypothetical protein